MVENIGIAALGGEPGFDPVDIMKASPGLQLIYETAPVGLAFLSTDCRYLMINQHLTEICGISISDDLGRSVRVFRRLPHKSNRSCSISYAPASRSPALRSTVSDRTARM